MSNITEIRAFAHISDCIICRTDNRDLAKHFLENLISLRKNALAIHGENKNHLLKYIDSRIARSHRKIGFRASDAAEYLESHTDSINIVYFIIAYLLFVLLIGQCFTRISEKIEPSF